jgi:hypothetical protein
MRPRLRAALRGIAVAACALAAGGAWSALAAPAPGADRSVPALLDACAARLDAERDIGVARVLAACPEVERAFADGAVRPWLPTDWRRHGEDLSAGSLRELASLLRETRAAPAGAPPDPALLAQVLAGNAASADDDVGAWRRFLRWLRAAAGLGSAGPQDGRFADWLRSGGRAETFWTLAGYVAFALALAFSAWIVRGELRALGFGRRGGGPLEPSSPGAVPPAAPGVDHAAAPLAERPGLLLRRLAAALAARQGLLRSEAWTVDELLAARPFADDERARQLTMLARVAESARYAAEAPDTATLREATLAGETLCRAVEQAAP